MSDTAANIKVNEQTGFDASVKFVANPYDEHGVEEAVTLVEMWVIGIIPGGNGGVYKDDLAR